MGDEGIFATTAEVQAKAGAGASTTYNVESYINQFMTEAESYINNVCEYNFSDNFATLNVDTKNILQEWAASLAAMQVIQCDLSTFSSLALAQTKLNVLYTRARECEALLKDKNKQSFIINS